MATRADSFGARMKLRREEKGLNQEQLAEKIGVSKAQISRYESDQDRPGYDKLIDITTELGCSADHLLTGANGVGGRMINPRSYELLLRLDTLPEALREYILIALENAESAKHLIPDRFLKSPTKESWQEFHDYLQQLADSLPKADPPK